MVGSITEVKQRRARARFTIEWVTAWDRQVLYTLVGLREPRKSDGSSDEFHYLFRCNYFVKERRKYIKCKYYNFPSTLKFEELMCKQDMPSMLNLCKFIMCV